MTEGNNIPRVVFIGLASCFGCQINITNAEAYLLDVLGQIDMRYWQLTSSEGMPEDFDIAVIEGAVTTADAIEHIKRVREVAKSVITIGACAKTGGIPGIASFDYDERSHEVYGDAVPQIVSDIAIKPCAVKDIIKVDYEVACCPVDPFDFVRVLQDALYGSNAYPRTSTLCGECKNNGRGCFYGRGVLCLGMITRSGCGARCPNLGRPCNGCAGMSDDANLSSARAIACASGINPDEFESALTIFNQVALNNQKALIADGSEDA